MTRRGTLDPEARIDLEISQQIANFNNCLSRIYAKLESLQNQCDELRADLKKRYDVLDSRQQAIESRVSVIDNKFDANVKQLYNEKNDLMCRIYDLEKNSLKMELSLDQRCEENHENYNHIAILDTALELIKNNVKLSLQGYDQRLYELEEKTKKNLSKALQEYLDIPDKYDDLKLELEIKSKELKVDYDGIMREINFYKKDAYITEKKLEKILTDIARLKGDKS